MLLYENAVQQTINGITFSFPGPDLNPTADKRHAKDKDGDLSEYFLWKNTDNPATHRLNAVLDVSGWKIELYTEDPKANDWWHYVIYAGGSCALQFERKRKGGQWEPCAPVTLLRLKLDSEADSAAVLSVSTFVRTARIEHTGSTCSVVWNPATRQYVRRCSP